jgi:hypothetical protein
MRDNKRIPEANIDNTKVLSPKKIKVVIKTQLKDSGLATF